MKPTRILLFIVCCMLGLAVLCLLLPGRIGIGDYTLRWPTLGQVLGQSTASQPMPDTNTPAYAEDWDIPEFPVFMDTIPYDTEEEAAPDQRPVAHPTVSVDSTIDSRVYLGSFYAALETSGTRKVRVMHYGDSQIEEDRMTQQIRQALQSRYGGAGVGLVPLVQTIPSRTVHQEVRMNGRKLSAQQGPQRYLVYGPKRTQRTDGLYGPMGQAAVMADSLVQGSEQLQAVVVPLDGGPRYKTMRPIVDSTIAYTRTGDTLYLSGCGNVYGITQETPTGVIVDNIPMRGCLGLVFTKIDSAQLARFYAEENVRLIIMQYGGNAIPFNDTPSTIRAIVWGLRQQVRYLQTCAPEASILFIGPSDMITSIDGVEQTYPMVPYMDRLLQAMAQEEGIAYFSLYHWMGGSGSMARWQKNGLAGSDGVHFLRSGARKAGNAVAEWILEGMDNCEL